MNLAELVALLNDRSIELSARNGELLVQGGKQALAEGGLLELLREHKAALVELIESGSYTGPRSAVVDVPPNLIPAGCDAITPEMLPLVTLSVEEIAHIVERVAGGAPNIQDIYPLAPLQEGIFFHHLMVREGDPYLLRSVTVFDSRSRLDAYLKAMQAVIDRHDILRTSVAWEGLSEPVQVVWREARLEVEEVRLDPADGDIVEQLRARFDPRRDRLDMRVAPLLRVHVAEDKPNGRWVMLLLFHHLVIDHTAAAVMQQEMQACLLGQQGRLPAPLPFRNFVAQTRLGISREEHETYFKKLLGDVDEPTAPFGLVNVQGDGSGITEARRAVDAKLARRLRERARALGVSAASIFHLAYAQVLARVSGRDDVVFGTVLFGRMQGGEGAERVLGLFINTLPVRIPVGEASVKESVRNTHTQLVQLLRHEHAPLALAQRASSVAAPAPLFSALLNYRYGASAGQASTAEARGIRHLGGEERTNYPFVLSVDDVGEGFSLKAQMQSPIDPERMCGYMHAALEQLVGALESTPASPLHSLDVLPAPERRQLLLEWNKTRTDYPSEASIAELLEAQVKRAPDAVALEYEGEELTYKELNARANRLARYLKKQGVGRGTLVGLCVERSLEMVVATLAILKAGGAYVPLDPEYPPERLRFMLEDTGAPVLLTQDRLRGRLPAYAGKVIALDSDWKKIARESAVNPKAVATADSLAYVIYTSGSTGTPKGVQVTHRGVNRLVCNTDYVDIRSTDRFAQASVVSFDAATFEIWGALLHGARVVGVSREVALSPREFSGFLRERGITVLFLTTALFNQMAREAPGAFGSLRYVLFGGELVDPGSVRTVLREGAPRNLLHVYGPTEVTTYSTWHPVARLDDAATTVPIGRPIANTTAYVLDQRRQPVPVGVPGELYLGGAGVARGYLNRPELTAERFVENPFGAEPGARLYRTGDWVRYLPDGAIEFIGRRDNQVKVRGFRIELGEIEAALARLAPVQEAVVMVREDSPGDKRVVAYVVPNEGQSEALADLRDLLRERLPDYMVPAYFVPLDALPLTPNGKVDRKALPAPERTGLEADYVAPRTAIEEKLAQIWAEVLKLERVGIHDNFFELGGHSLLAVTLIERMRRAGLNADVRALFTTSTLAELAAAVGGESGIVEVPANRIPAGCEAITPEMLPLVTLSAEEIARIAERVPGGASRIQDIYPLAPLQEGILFHHLMAREGDPYLLHTLTGFDSRARLDHYLEALQWVIDRHDILRTAVLWEELEEPVQVVWREARLNVEEVKLDPADGDVGGQLRARFDPRRYRLDIRQAPLLRVFIAQDKPNARWVMLQLFHHLAIDHTAAEVVQQEVRAYLLGEAEKLPAPLPFRNFVAQARFGVPREEHEAYFKELLGDVEETTASFGLVDVQGDGSGIAEARRRVDPQLAKRLRARARALGVSAAALCHLAYAQVLARTSGRDDVVFGTVLFGRMQGGEGAERVLGLFINTLPVRIRVGEAGVEESVKSAHAQLAQLLRHEHASLALAQRASRVAAPAPLFSSFLNYRHISSAVQAHMAQDRQAWEGIRYLGGEERTNYPLVLSVDDLGEGLGLTAQAQSPIDPQRICGYMERALEELVHALETAPATAVRALEVLPAPEREQVLVGWNATQRDYGVEQRLHRLIEAQAKRAPDAVALEYEGRELSYGELNRRANQLARVLRKKGVGPDALVGVFAERCFEMVVALLAILKAGGAYVPLDPEYPAERLGHMLEDARVSLVLAQPSLAGTLPASGAQVLELDSSWAAYASEPGGDLEDVGTPQSLAYAIFTSGSTGRPKGAMNEHRGIVNRLLWMQEEYGLGAADAVLQKTPYSFDVSVWEFFWPLMTGARLVIARPEGHRDSAYLVRLIQERAITTLHFVPSMLRVFLEERDVEACRSLKRVICSGEALTHELQERLFARLPSAQLHNLYGPTEAAVDVTYWACRRGDARLTVPIGRPVANTQMYVLDGRRNPLPAGVPGELYIGGVQVGRGYVGRPDLTAERFVPDPFSKTPGARLYKTGDLARHLSDGAIEYLGRADFQVKIRGQRIELGEIEAVLDKHPGVAQSVVLAREDTAGDQRLVAYVVAKGEAPAAAQLKEHLASQLPQYMVPSAFVTLEALPLTSSGKVDRKALPAPERTGLEADYVAPRTPTEETLAAIWAEVLKVERVGMNDNFFELGGHSLLAITLIERMRRAGLHADVRALFTTPTIAELTQALGAESTVAVPANAIPAGCEAITSEMLPLIQLTADEIARIVAKVPGGAANIQDIYPLAPLQEGILFHHLMARAGDPYLLCSVTAFDSRARLDSYLQALQSVIDRHDILRTGVLWEGLAEPVQVVWRHAPLKVDEISFDPANGEVARQLAARFDPRRYRIDIGEAPLLRVFIAEDRANARWVMLRLFQHLAIDHTTVEGMHQEVQAYLLGEEAKLPSPLPFRNFVAQARLGVKREEHEAYFKKLLSDVEETTAPFGLADVQGEGSGITEAHRALEPQLARRLRERARALGVSAASLCHLAYGQVLARVSGREDVVFGTVLFGRMQGGEGADRALGMFINTLPVRIRVGEAGVEESARNTHAQLAQLLRHEHASLALAQRASRVAAPAPLFSALLNYRHSAVASRVSAQARLAWEGMSYLASEERTNYPLVLSVDDLGEGLRLTAQAQSPLDPERICDYMQRALEELVAALEKAPATPLRSLDILPEPERRQLLIEWNDTKADFPAARCVQEWVEEQARAQPKALAVQCGAAALSYGELEARAEALSARLNERGVRAGALVAVYVERSVEMVVALLAAWKAGAAYVPIDPQYPPERVRFMLEDAQAPVVVTQESLAGGLPATGAAVVSLDADEVLRAPKRGRRPKRAPMSPQSLAYVIYTSGSTGQPKGVQITHASLCNLIYWHQRAYGVTPADRATQLAGPAFDASVWELWPYLTAGASVHLPDEATRLDPANLVRWLVERAITVSFLPTPLAEAALREHWPKHTALRVLLTGGDRLNQRPAQTLPFRLINHYGPTENTVVSTCAEVEMTTRGAPPIGRPLPNTRAYVLDSRLQPVPVGVPGELLVGGVQLAGGYWKRPELTQEKFVPDPFQPGGQLYRTGDLVRYLADGNIEFLGRIDTQVKVRGFRIELGEIEAALGEHAGVREAVVLAREDAPGEKRLVAYVVGEASAAELKEHLATRLPSYMVPSAFVTLEALPLTPNGKVDRKALPAPERTGLEAEYVAPRNATEEILAGIWAEVLKVERVGVNDNFFELGGHSLLATQVVSRVRQALSVELPLRELFTAPTIAELAQRAEALRAEPGAGPAMPALEAAAEAGPVALSFAQQRLWFLDRLEPGSGAYNISGALELRGALEVGLLERALSALVDRHQALRTVFVEVGGEPRQVVGERGGWALSVTDVSGEADGRERLKGLLRQEAARGFDLARGPLFRAHLYRLGAERHVLLLAMHHIVSDGWSMGVLIRELGELYRGLLQGALAKLPALRVQYRDFARWQRGWLKGEVLERELAHWRGRLKGAPQVLELPTDRVRPALESHRGASYALTLPRELVDRLHELSRREGATLFMTLLAGFTLLLSRYSSQQDLLIGTPVANRNRAEIEGLIGFFVNTLVLRADSSGEPSVREFLARLREACLEAYAHQDLPFERLVEELHPVRDLSRNAVFQVMFALQNAPQGALDLPGLTLKSVEVGASAAQFDLSLLARETPQGLGAVFSYATDLFDESTVARMGAHWRALLEAMVATPERRVSELPLLTEPERHQVLEEWNRTERDYGVEQRLHRLIEAQAKRAPDAVALEYEGRELSYGELNRRANQLARVLRKKGVGPDALVGVFAERCFEMVVALLAILKAGGAYVPLDPEYPAERLGHMLEDARVSLVLAQPSLAGTLPASGAQVLELDSSWAAYASEPGGDLEDVGTPQSLAYAIFTSGSTGRPKGAMNEHRGIVNRLLWMQEEYGLGAADAVLQKTPYSFDVSVWEFFWPLMTGARLVIARPEGHRDSAYLVRLIQERAITTLHFVPSMLRVFLEERDVEACRSLKRVICSGEALTHELQERLFARLPSAQLHNLYGPTEAAVDVTYWACRRGDARLTVPIGRPVANTQMYVLDGRRNPLPAGVPGELYIGGVQVGRGYVGRPDLTAERFVPDPFSKTPGARLYKTGDLARHLSDGAIEYLGRADFQVKIRGQRIELGEIEAVLDKHPGVAQSVVLAREDTAGDQRLVAYVVAKGEAPAAAQLKEHLASQLPQYMVPSAFVTLEALPLTSSGKVDRKALPAPERTGLEADYVAPRTPTEETLAAIWAEVLKVERVGMNDNFFELGGHSLLATQVVSRVRAALSVDLPLRELFMAPKISTLAMRIEALRAKSGSALVPDTLNLQANFGKPAGVSDTRVEIEL